MATVDVTYARARSSRAAAAKAAKAKRQRMLLVGGAVAFVLLLVIQVPRTLRMLNPPAPPPAPAEAAPAATPAPAAPAATPALDGERLRRFLAQFELKDPFAQRTAIQADAAVPVRPTLPGETDPFAHRAHIVASNGPIPAPPRPDAAPASASQPASAAARAAAKPAAAAAPRFTIVLASIPARNGRSAAVGTAAGARAKGVSGAGVLRSADYPLLRPGYIVVHSRIFDTRREAERALAYARKTGYSSAYIRRIR